MPCATNTRAILCRRPRSRVATSVSINMDGDVGTARPMRRDGLDASRAHPVTGQSGSEVSRTQVAHEDVETQVRVVGNEAGCRARERDISPVGRDRGVERVALGLGKRFVAVLWNATYRPSAEIAGEPLSRSPCTPLVEMLTRSVSCVLAPLQSERAKPIAAIAFRAPSVLSLRG